MSAIELAYYAGCLILAIASPYMIFATCYEDGILGKLALGAVFIGAIAALTLGFSPGRHEVRPHDAAMVAGVAVFVLRHLIRFWQYQHRSRGMS